MAKPKSPKKGTDLNESVSPSNPSVLSTSSAPGAPPPVIPAAEASPAVTANPQARNGDARRPAIVKSEIVKKEMRANLVPINLDDEIRRLAYLLSERRGFAPGHEAEDWLDAEREVHERYHQHSA